MKNRAFDHSKYKDWIRPEEVTPYEKNAKKHDDRQIKNIVNSINRFGWQQDTVLTADNVCVIGHGRRLAAIKLGCDMPFHRIDKTADALTDEDIRELRIADNQTNAETGMDFSVLEAELEDLSFDGFDFDFEGMFDGENGGGDNEFSIAEDEPPEPPKTAIAKRGDIWQLGNHRLMCGDSTDADAWAKLMDGEKADIVFTSPPYNAGFGANLTKNNGRSSKYENDDDNKTQDEYRAFINAFIATTAKYVDYQFVNIQMLANNKRALAGIVYDNKDRLADVIIWDKTRSQPQLAENVLNSEFEFVFVFSDDGTRAIGKKPFHGTIKNIIHIGNVTDNEYAKIHNATFTVELAAWFVSHFSVESVADAFGGTGTTLIACEQLKRKCYMMELEPKYCDVIVNRWEKFTGEKAVLLT